MKKLQIAGLLVGAMLLVAVPLYLIHKTAHQTVQAAPVARGDDYLSYWKSLPKDAIADSWGNGIRECTSWVAWRAWQDLRYNVPRDWLWASNWPAAAAHVGLLVDNTPAVGSAAVDTSFYPGHVMWVDKVNSDKIIRVSQYNAGEKGTYSETNYNMNIAKLVFIHFPKVNKGF